MHKYHYELTHHHKHGSDKYVFTSQRTLPELPEPQDICKTLDIPFDPENSMDGYLPESVELHPTEISDLEAEEEANSY